MRYLVGTLVVVSFALLLWRRQSLPPPSAQQRHEDSGQSVHNLDNNPLAKAEWRINAIERRIVNERPTERTFQSGDRPSFHFTMNDDRREAVKRLTGVHPLPAITPRHGQMEYSIEEVLEMFPDLQRLDGTPNMEAAEKIQNHLRELLEMSHQNIALAASKDAEELLKPSFAAMGTADHPHHKIREVLRGIRTLPNDIRPTSILSEIAREFGRLDTLQMRGLIFQLATAQTEYESGRDPDFLRRRVKGFSPHLNPPMTDEQANVLLNTPLEELATAEYAK